uniref:Uncharacterized protein n=1 Tax=viral metagenome TaxID=1070528 RepID=A0A6C0E3W5_9ZZZZ
MEYTNIINDWLCNNKHIVIHKLKKYNNRISKVQKRDTQIRKIFAELQVIDPTLYKQVQTGGAYFDTLNQTLGNMYTEIKDRDTEFNELKRKTTTLIEKLRDNLQIIDKFKDKKFVDDTVAVSTYLNKLDENGKYSLTQQMNKFSFEKIDSKEIQKYEKILTGFDNIYKSIKDRTDKREEISKLNLEIDIVNGKYQTYSEELSQNITNLIEINKKLYDKFYNIKFSQQYIKIKTIEELRPDKTTKLVLVKTEENIFHNKKENTKIENLSSIIKKATEEKDALFTQNVTKIRAKFKEQSEIQSGGNTYAELFSKLLKLHQLKIKFKVDFDNYKEEFSKYTEIYNDVYAYVAFLVSSMIENMYKDKITEFKYINRSFILLYLKRVEAIKKDIDNPGADPSKLFMKQQYKIPIYYIYDLFKFLIETKKTPQNAINLVGEKDYVVIDECGGTVRQTLNMFNMMRKIIELYYNRYKQNVTIYAIINSRQTPTIRFTKQNDDVLQYNNGKQMTLKFNEVFDSGDNDTTSNAMSMPTDLSLEKPIVLITSGYSGAGKTYTLFGAGSKTGLIHSTIKDIGGLEKLHFRVYEIYGLAVPYSFYFDKKDISHNIFHHKYDGINFTETKEEDMASFMSKNINEQNFFTIGGSRSIDDFFATFEDKISKKIDNKRTHNSYVHQVRDPNFDPRIRKTPNNPVSSRSILIYDFRLMIKNNDTKKENEVKFIVVDMPGRENIYETYVESYLKKTEIHPIICPDKDAEARLRMILTFINLHPLYIGFFHGKVVLDYINNNNKEILQKFYNNDRTLVSGKSNNILQYIVNDEKQYKLSDIFKLNHSGKIDLKPGMANPVDKWIQSTHSDFRLPAYNYKNNNQYYSLIALFIMYNLILENKFDVIKQIINTIVDLEINTKIDTYFSTQENFTTVIITNLITALKTSGDIPEDFVLTTQNVDTVKDAIKYKYDISPYQAFYINENTMGLFSTAINDLSKKEKTIFKTQKNIDINSEKSLYRVMLQCGYEDRYPNKTSNGTDWIKKVPDMFKLIIDDYKYPPEQSQSQSQEEGKRDDSYKEFVNTHRIHPLVLESSGVDNSPLQYATLLFKKQDEFYRDHYYKPDEMFNTTNPIMKTILKPLIDQVKKTPWDCKIAYIVANYENIKKDNISNEKKTEEQIKLLEQIKPIISALN